ncbi:helix-turn-helix domain-containing protein [Lentilactobacillus hilgardii]|uniref:hypothetical protein n=1 Tax=Lentilactobacillus hilgardii TaxID=1588 RepID=UPI001CDCF0F9|nr:hypothetical protein [Lentilactobacillus hilgardii]
MQASTKNKDFFSKKFNDYYVIYTRDELAMKLGVNVSTITEVFKRLVKKGYLVMKHQFNGATKLFLPKFENETNPEANHDNVKRKSNVLKLENPILVEHLIQIINKQYIQEIPIQRLILKKLSLSLKKKNRQPNEKKIK